MLTTLTALLFLSSPVSIDTKTEIDYSNQLAVIVVESTHVPRELTRGALPTLMSPDDTQRLYAIRLVAYKQGCVP